MNNDRRNRIRKLISQLEDIQNEIENILSDEQEAFDNMPEGFQESERGEKMQAAINHLEDIEISDIIGNLENSME